jgi:dihydroorotase
MSSSAAAIAGIRVPSIVEGVDADLCLFDPDHTWTLDQKTVQSRSWNSPWWGAELRGRAVLTVAAGRVVWDLGA